jgi:hypothetical protein
MMGCVAFTNKLICNKIKPASSIIYTKDKTFLASILNQTIVAKIYYLGT